MKQFIIRCGLVVACTLAGCGGEEGVEDVKEEWEQEEPEDSPVTAMHVPVEQRDSVLVRLDNLGPTSSVLSMLPNPSTGRRFIQIRTARPRRTVGSRIPTTPKTELNDLDLGNPRGNQFPGIGRDLGGSFSSRFGQPAPSGDVSSDYYVQAVNGSLAVFNTTGRVLVGPIPAQLLWHDTPCGTSGVMLSDGTVRYDALGEVWIITYRGVASTSSSSNEPRLALGAVEAASTAGQESEPHEMRANHNRYFQCVAVSTTPHPTGVYHRYVASVDGFNEAPKLGVWRDGYYLTGTMHSSHLNSTLRRARVCAMEREKMLRGEDAKMLCFNVASHPMHYADLLPADLDVEKPLGLPPPPGRTPPMGSPLYVFSLRQTEPGNPRTSGHYDFFNRLGVWKVFVDWADPASSKLIGPLELRVDPFPMGVAVRQKGTTQRLDPLDYKLVGRAPYRNFNGRQAILLTHAVPRIARGGGTAPGSGLRWYELELPADPLNDWPIVAQRGTYAPDANFRWLGSIAFDRLGNIALAFTRSSASENPSLRYTGRTTACDTSARGTMSRSEQILKGGNSSQLRTPIWGTTSTLNVGPDGCTFWYTAEYRGDRQTGDTAWSTHIGSFRLPGCDAPIRPCNPVP
ncbi:hypothetical protein ACN28E_03360 [Archangium lansingense]|uniref:hypothetical protein n=1 Tax=Archangium lansingense TaxID=2995310 RepID=UPI003B7E08D3